MLVDGQGNFGSIDGDSPRPCATPKFACRRSPTMLADLDKETVDFRRQLRRHRTDSRGPAHPGAQPAGQRFLRHRRGHGDQYPAAQPDRGGQRMPGLIDDPELTVDELMEHMPGPGLPDRRHHQRPRRDYAGLPQRPGRIYVRARAEVITDEKRGKDTIIVHELPYQVNKARLIEKHRRTGQGKEDRGHHRAAGRVRQGRPAGGDRAAPRRGGRRGAEQPVRPDRSCSRYSASTWWPWSTASQRLLNLKEDSRGLCPPPPRGGDPAHRLPAAQGPGARPYPRGPGDCAGQYRPGDRADQGVPQRGRGPGEAGARPWEPGRGHRHAGARRRRRLSSGRPGRCTACTMASTTCRRPRPRPFSSCACIA